tara:strand:- start:765 stop:1292 length:528 start_codon:yes stop_codon:yes gene_type:complete
MLGTWIIVASIISIVLRFKFSPSLKYIKGINSFIAHIGVGIMIIGITYSSIYQKEYSFNVKTGDVINLASQKLKFDKIKVIDKKNYQALKAVFSLEKNGEIVSYIKPGKNFYPVSKMITTEAGIYHDWFEDIYITLGNEINNLWFVRVYINPLVSFIWIGVFIMIFSSIIAVLKK